MSRKRYADDFDDYNEEVIVLPESPPSPDEYEDNILYKYMTYSNGQDSHKKTANTHYQLAPPPSDNKEPSYSGQNTINAKASVQKPGIKATPIDWKEEEGRLMLRRYKDYALNVGKDKKFKSKREMWNCITEEVNETFNVKRSTAQCMSKFFHRYQSMKKPKKQIEGVVNFQEELNSLDAIHDLVIDELMNSKTESIEDKEKQESLSVLYQILPKTMVELAKINAHAQERRHREYMDSIKEFENKFLESVSKIIDKY
ncbi:uncharacterized protein LOC112684625 isoform X2 [Sipha flava]|uniref:Uncharacterized protein LOC112684625 isoform X2 n=1 Tax=Sipha flava TaxID=143950 RepID=A0A8B8FN73_9HEMI|nr:uncharacterized protein LOC112684625 isoform X2 [Sipha flava]